MPQLRRFFLRLYNLVRPQRAEREISRELDSHLTLIEDDCRRRGMPDAEARRAARQAIGGVAQAKESHRAARSFVLLDDLWRDVRYAIRTLGQSPAFTSVAVLTLALGIGATTAIFSVVNAVLLTPLQVPDAARLVRFVTVHNGDSSPVAGSPEFSAWQSQSAVEDVAAHRLEFINLTGAATPEQLPVARVSNEFFRLFHTTVIRGRVFTGEEDRPGGAAVAVVSYALWTRRFDGDPEILGRTMTLGAVPYKIIGVIDAGFDSEQFDPRPDVWIPFQIDPNRIDGGNLFLVTGRLKNGYTGNTANAQLASARIAYEQRRSIRRNPSVTWAVQPLQEAMVSSTRLSLQLLLAAVMLVLLIACANVASLLIVRGNARQREVAIRIAIGAGRGRIMRQLLTESLVLSVAGGVLGFGVAALAVRSLRRTTRSRESAPPAPPSLPTGMCSRSR
jgi:putative ABC transport system permease protein